MVDGLRTVDALFAVRRRLATAVRNRPVAAAAVLVLAVGAVRVADVLVLGLHERVGALVLSTVLAPVGAAAFLRLRPVPTPAGSSSTLAAGRDALATDPRTLRRAALVGVGGVAAVQAVAHGLELAALGVAGLDAAVTLAAVNPATKSGAVGGVATYLLFGVLLAALGEELLFRRALLGTLSARLGFRRANAVQAALFGAWHLAWPLVLLVSPAEPLVPLGLYAVGLVFVTGTVGAVFGWLVRATGTLWTAVAAHLVHNGIAVVVHVRTPAGEPRASVLSAALVLGYVLLAWGAWRRFGNPTEEDAVGAGRGSVGG